MHSFFSEAAVAMGRQVSLNKLGDLATMLILQ